MNICRFPKRNNLAVAARLKTCGESATVRTKAFIKQGEKTIPVETMACLSHAVEAAVGKLTTKLKPTFVDLNEMYFLESKRALDEVEVAEIEGFKANKYFFRGGLLHKAN